MVVIYGFLFLFLFLPILGEFLVLWQKLDLFVIPSWELFWANLLFSLIILFIPLLMSFKRTNNSQIVIKKPNLTLLKCLIVMFSCCVFVFIMAGYKFIFLGVDRGTLRISLGLWGPLYTWIISYLVPVIVALAYIAFSHEAFSKSNSWMLYLVILFALLCGIFTGYKSTVVTTFLPVLTIFFLRKRNYFQIIKFSSLAFVAIVLSTMLVRGSGFVQSTMFILHRMSVMAATGTIGVAQEFPNGVPFNQSIKLAYSSLGNHLTKFFMGQDSSSLEVIETNLARLISYLVYPDIDAVIEGRVNLTVTNFGEAIYIFGLNNGFYIIYAVFIGSLIGYIFKVFEKKIYNNTVVGLTILAYIFGVILPSLNSGGVWNLLSITSLVYIFFTYFALLILVRCKFI